MFDTRYKKVTDPSQMSMAFAEIFNNGRDLDAWISLYEPDAILYFGGPDPVVGHEAIRKALTPLVEMPGKIETRINFCAVNGDIAVVRGDCIGRHEGEITFAASSVEVVRRQADGSWLYMIDHAAGASLPSAWETPSA
ncbi:YybH family protein [Herbaspirillum sp. NPDC101396]|uniref:YybH family protein n=1 Tax=Herbaspirillum sp. NPDC101396 TaxID=3364005 RepID=UPI00383B72A3